MSRPRLPKISAAVLLVQAGYTPADAAAEVDAAVRSVRSACRQLGVPFGNPERRERISAGLRNSRATATKPQTPEPL